MIYVEAPHEYTSNLPLLFLAGGITVANPRRENFPIHDSSASKAQITWEFNHLRRADAVLFWFAGGPSIQPIALYELGAHAANTAKRIVVGADPAYKRLQDVIIQIGLVRPEVEIRDSLEATCRDALAVLT
jgi:hypothetical protein